MHPLRIEYKKIPVDARLIIEAAALGTIIGFGGYYSWLFDLFANFRLHYIFIFVLCIGWFVWRGLWPLAFTALVLLAINVGTLAYYQNKLDVSRAGLSQPRLNIISANLNSSPISPELVRIYLSSGNTDIAILTEISPPWEAYFKQWNLPFEYQVIQAQPDNFGIALLSRWPLEDIKIGALADGVAMPSILAKVITPLGTFQIVATHPPPPIAPFLSRWRNATLLAIAEILRTSPIPVLVAGDLNATPWSYPLNEIIALPNVKGGSVYGTWPSVLPSLGLPIDHIFVTGPYAFAHYGNGPITGSDHMPLEAVLVKTPQ